MTGRDRMVVLQELHVEVRCLDGIDDIEAGQVIEETTRRLQQWAAEMTERADRRFTVTIEQ